MLHRLFQQCDPIGDVAGKGVGIAERRGEQTRIERHMPNLATVQGRLEQWDGAVDIALIEIGEPHGMPG